VIAIRRIEAKEIADREEELAALLVDAVESGASVNFLRPFGRDDARPFWRSVRDAVACGELILLGAFAEDALLGSVQLALDTPPNQRHRADVAKLLVLRRARRRGIARSLMEALEREAAAAGRTLLTLDTRRGDAGDRLYETLGYCRVGIIPRHALSSAGRLDDTCFFYKEIGARPAAAATLPALVLIDLQRGIDDPRWGVRNNPHAERNAARLLEAWRARKAPIFHVRHDSGEADSTYRPGQRGHAFKEVVAPLLGEPVIAKRTPSAFIGTDLEARLRQGGLMRLALCGVKTNNSLEATARMAGCLGFDTRVVADASFTFDQVDWGKRHRTADEVHAMALANLSGEYATIVTTDELLATLAQVPQD
jgi:nicotinamidase-related amidase/ribosomal protein S18 acetylase RimI-like enzyme